LKRLRVLEAITPSTIGGAEVYLAKIARRFPRMGAEVDVFCPTGRGFVEFAGAQGVETIGWKTHGKIDPITIIRLARLLGNRDIIHTHLSTASLLGAFAAKLAGRPSVAQVSGLNTATCYRRSTLVVAVSEAIKRHLCAQGMRPEKIRVVYNGIEVDEIDPIPLVEAKRALGYEEHTPLIGVFGRLSPEKGHTTALEAMFVILKRVPGARLVITGTGRDREELESSAEALGIRDNVDFAGFVPSVREYQAACDVVLVPSLKEGLPTAALETMALERPVVATDVGGLPEIVVDGETGLLVGAQDPGALAEAVVQLLEDPTFAARMGANGRQRVRERFNIEKQLPELLAVLREVAESAA